MVALDGQRHVLDLEPGTLAFTYCQAPIVYRQSAARRLIVTGADGRRHELPGDTLDADRSAALFMRTGTIARIDVDTAPGQP